EPAGALAPPGGRFPGIRKSKPNPRHEKAIVPHARARTRHNLGESREEFLRPNGGRAHGLWSSHGGGNCSTNPVPPHFRNPNRTPDRIHDAGRQSSAKRHGGGRSAVRWHAATDDADGRSAHA